MSTLAPATPDALFSSASIKIGVKKIGEFKIGETAAYDTPLNPAGPDVIFIDAVVPDELFMRIAVVVSTVQPYRKVGTYKVGHTIKIGPLFTAQPDELP